MKNKTYIWLLPLIFIGLCSSAYIFTTYSYLVLGDNPNAGQAWNNDGRPEGTYVVSTRLTPPAESAELFQYIYDTISIATEAFIEEHNRNFLVVETGAVYITLGFEDADWFNTLGFYTYPHNDPPESIADIENTKTIVFPKLDTENTINNGFQLYLGDYTAGTVIGFFLVSQGWDHTAPDKVSAIVDGRYTLYSNSDLNEGVVDPDGTEIGFLTHSVVVANRRTTERDFLLCFEDDIENADYDYNDAVFFVHSSPENAIITFNGEVNEQIVARDTTITLSLNQTSTVPITTLIEDEVPEDAVITITSISDPMLTTTQDLPSISVLGEDTNIGTDTIFYTACDLGFPQTCDDGMIIVTTSDQNEPPVARDSVLIDFDDPLFINGITVADLATDPDDNLDLSTIAILSDVDSNLNLTITGGTITFAPNQDYSGPDFILYRICDLGSPVYCDVGSFIIGGNDGPIANPDEIDIYAGEGVIMDVLGNDTPGSSPLDPETLTIISKPDDNTATVNVVDGKIENVPHPDFTGPYEIIYEICDSGTPTLCDTSTITVNVVDPQGDEVIDRSNIPPLALNDSVVTNVNTAISIEINNNDSDEDGIIVHDYSYIVKPPLRGEATLNVFVNNGQSIPIINYTPNEGFTGLDVLSYRVYDDGDPHLSDDALALIFITEDGVTITTNNDTLWVDTIYVSPSQESCFSIANKLAEENSTLNVTSNIINVYPKKEGASLNYSDSVICYQAPENMEGTDHVYYTICDAWGTCQQGLLVIIEGDGTPKYEEPLLTFYSGFSPNGDQLNDAFVIEGIGGYPDNDITIYNRWGQPVYKGNGYDNTWNGNNQNNEPLPDGTYYYILKVRTPYEFNYNGYVVIKR
ncbi:Ig-like domain-containing protein [Flammeovirga agarivorans]|uniref:T9SS type B sorting domain-containing protein n=1 Tax=Flammeovirga agarivorans TaxID=2726742 RepID=A0A7X8XYW0_9BACT|nr:Ig-like domain-containing protein [Flammeovirga agarivorans]NLR94592.1 T9SS type B sorting domain-containing protein [Flammeovirga agarivorans]